MNLHARGGYTISIRPNQNSKNNRLNSPKLPPPSTRGCNRPRWSLISFPLTQPNMHQSTNPVDMLKPENNDIYSLSDVLQVLNIHTYWHDYTDRLQALQKIKSDYHTNLKHQPELAPLHESTLINQLHDLQLQYTPLSEHTPTNEN